MRVLCYAQTNIGSGRDNNEDNYYCNGTFKRDPAIPVAEAAAEQESRRLIYGVFDGMGGEANGEQAALLCAQTLHQCSSDEPFDALDFFRRANVAVCDMIAASGQIGGSTAATVHLTGNRAYCCNVGDSRIYLQRGGALQRISRDHTKYQEQLDAGAAAADAADNPDRHVLTQYLGMLGARQRLMPYFAASVPLAVGDRLLLCTDGLTGKLSDSQLQAALGADLPLPELGQALMAQALAAGPGDNITLVLIEITALDAETAVPLPQPPADELSQTRRFEVPAARIAEQETQRKKHAHARRREIILTVAVVLAVLAAATVHLTGNRAYCCNVGDSRIYLQRGGALQRISRDHTKYQEQLDAGAAAADAADNPDRHVLTQYLGMLGARQRLMPYFAASVPLAVGDRLLLCTDGLTGKLSDSQLQAALGADLPLPELGQALMAQALAAGPGDNITLVLIEITALDAETAVPLPQPPADELSQTRRFEVPAARIAEQETQRKKHAHARRREIILTVAVVLAVLAAVIAALWLAVGSIPRKHPAPASTPVQTVAPTPTPASVNPPQIILPPPPTPEPEPFPEVTPEPSPDTTHVPETAAPENLPG